MQAFKSRVIKIYTRWLEKATPEQIEFVDEVYALCSKHYENGGDTIVEGWEPKAILEQFKTLEEVREYCGLKLEQATNCRWGSDDDPELKKRCW